MGFPLACIRHFSLGLQGESCGTILSVAMNRKLSRVKPPWLTVWAPCELYRIYLFKCGISSARPGTEVCWSKAIKQAVFIFGFWVPESSPFGAPLFPAHLSSLLRVVLLGLLKSPYQSFQYRAPIMWHPARLWEGAGNKKISKSVFVSQDLLILVEKKDMYFCQAPCLLLLRHSLKERILLSPLSDEGIKFGSPQNQNSDIYIQIPTLKNISMKAVWNQSIF